MSDDAVLQDSVMASFERCLTDWSTDERAPDPLRDELTRFVSWFPSIRAALKYAALPEGMVLVPREPTEAMIRAAMERLNWWTEPRAPEYENGGSALIADGLSEEEAAEINGQLRTEFVDVYAAMISAIDPSGTAEGDGWQHGTPFITECSEPSGKKYVSVAVPTFEALHDAHELIVSAFKAAGVK